MAKLTPAEAAAEFKRLNLDLKKLNKDIALAQKNDEKATTVDAKEMAARAKVRAKGLADLDKQKVALEKQIAKVSPF